MRPSAFALMLVALAIGGPADAAAPAPTCTDATPKPVLAAWAEPAVGLTAAKAKAGVAVAVIVPGRRMRLALAKQNEVTFAHATQKPPKADTYAGLVRFSASEAATYRITLSNAAWLDAVSDGKLVIATEHGHGPGCKGKFVEFPLSAGAHIIQISNGTQASIDILITRKRAP